CFAAGSMLDNGEGGPRDLDGAIALLEIPCATSGVCSSLAEKLVKSTDPAKRARGAQMLEAACTETPSECDRAAKQLAALTPPDRRARALAASENEFHERECAAGQGMAGLTPGDNFERGLGTAKTPTKPAASRKKGCDLGCDFACAKPKTK